MREKGLTVIAGLSYSQEEFHRHATFAEEGARLAREVEAQEVLAMATYPGRKVVPAHLQRGALSF